MNDLITRAILNVADMHDIPDLITEHIALTSLALEHAANKDNDGFILNRRKADILKALIKIQISESSQSAFDHMMDMALHTEKKDGDEKPVKS